MTSNAAKSRCAHSPRITSVSPRLLVPVTGAELVVVVVVLFCFPPFYHYTVQYYYYGTLFEKWNFVRTAGIPMATRTAHGTALNPEAMRTSHFPRGSSFSSTLSLSFSFLRGIQQLFPSVGRCCVLCHVFPVA